MAKQERKQGPRERRLRQKPYLGEEGAVRGGRAGGDLARNIGTRDEKKRAFERPAPVTRVRKKDRRKD